MCSGCNISLPLGEYSRDRYRRDGFNYRCRMCTHARWERRNDALPPLPPDLPDEEWRPLPTYETLYEISSYGRVKGLTGTRHRNRPHILTQRLSVGGYPTVVLVKNTMTKTPVVHRFVMLAFRGPRPKGSHINHVDGIKTNNRLDNLEYCSPKENAQHAMKLRLRPRVPYVPPEHRARGSRNHFSKLTECQVREIKALLKLGLSNPAIAERYGVVSSTIRFIQTGETWSHLT